MRDNLSGAAGLEQAITASAIESPEPTRDEVSRLATRLQRSWRLSDALRTFAAVLADRTADLVVAGCAVLEAICDCCPVERLRIADRGLREGILVDLIGSAQG